MIYKEEAQKRQNVKIMGLPEELDAEVQKAIAMSDASNF